MEIQRAVLQRRKDSSWKKVHSHLTSEAAGHLHVQLGNSVVLGRRKQTSEEQK